MSRTDVRTRAALTGVLCVAVLSLGASACTQESVAQTPTLPPAQLPATSTQSVPDRGDVASAVALGNVAPPEEPVITVTTPPEASERSAPATTIAGSKSTPSTTVSDPGTTTTTSTGPSGSTTTTAPKATTTSTTTTLPPGYISPGDEASFLSLINGTRSGSGLDGLTRDGGLDGYARWWAEEMANAGELAHSGRGGIGSAWVISAENVGVGGTVSILYSSMTSSSGHVANITDSRFTHVGIGVWVDGSGRLWTAHVFAAK